MSSAVAPWAYFSGLILDAVHRSPVLVEVFMRPGRPAELKRALYARLHANFAEVWTRPSDVLVAIHEIDLENWGCPAEP